MNANASGLAWLGPPISSFPPNTSLYPVKPLYEDPKSFYAVLTSKCRESHLRTFVGNQTTNVRFLPV